ncbi:MAG: CHAT domain-containing protein [Prolixibacteraceae bacterium]
MKIFFKSLTISMLKIVVFLFFLHLSLVSFSDQLDRRFKQDSLMIGSLNIEGREAQKIGDFEKALSLYRSSYVLSEKLYGKQNQNLFLPLINTGIVYKNLGEYNKAIETYIQAEELIKKFNDENDPRLGFVYTNLGTIYKIQGDYVRYNEFQNAALRVFLKDSARYSSQIQLVRIASVDAIFLQREFDKAILISKKQMRNTDDENRSYYTSLLARTYEQKGDIDLAEKYYQQTFRILEKLYGNDSYDLGLEYTNYVYFLLASNRLEQIPMYNELARKIISKYFTEKSTQYSEVMLNQGNYYFLRNTEASNIDDFRKKRRADLNEALSFYQKAIIAGTTSFFNHDLYSNPLPDQAVSEIHLLQIMKEKSRCLQVLGDLNLSDQQTEEAVLRYKAALAAITLSADLIHLIRTGYVSEDSRLILSESEGSVFSEAVNICYKLYRQTDDVTYAYQAFQFAERGKSASFLAAVTDSRAKKIGNIPDSLVTREQVLKLNVSNYKEMLFEEKQEEQPDSARIALYTAKLFQYSEKYSQLVNYLEDNFPDYYTFKYKTDVIDVATIRKKLDGREALVEYLLDNPDKMTENGKLFRFVITSDDFIFTRTAIGPGFIKAVGDVHRFLTNPSYLYTGLAEFQEYAGSAFRLQRHLLGDVTNRLEGKRLIVIPDDQLAYIPFDALLSSMPDTSAMNFRDLPYLVKDYPISYTYSATLLYSYFSKRKEADKRLLAFAPSYVNDDRDVSQIAKKRGGLLPLPFVSREVEYVNHFIPGDVFSGSLAGEERFKEMAGDYDILHLAMHTILNDSLPMYSGLAFSKPLTGSAEDGWLNTSEIYTMNLKARMAVLSACNTGTGRLQKGEGVMSLARGFLYAGCPSIIMSLWEVDDESGSLIMRDFYRLIAHGKNKDEALQLAKLLHIEHADPLKAHPHYWLGFVAVGNADALYTGRDVYFVVILFAVILLFIIDQLYRKKRRTTRT